jgi:double stranded RNA-specific editase B
LDHFILFLFFSAMFGRIEDYMTNLPKGFRLNRPKMALTTSSEARTTLKSPSHSVNWVEGCGNAEVLSALTGKKIDNPGPSRLCKKFLYSDYRELVEKLPGLTQRSVFPTYLDAKLFSKGYQKVKDLFYAAFTLENLGEWVKKPCEQDVFIR